MNLRLAPQQSGFVSLASLGAVIVAAAGLVATAICTPATARERSDLEFTSRSLVGGYLSGRFAKSQHDIASAAAFYGSALAHDPDNEVLVEQAFLMELSAGDHERTALLAGMLIELQPQHRLARMFL